MTDFFNGNNDNNSGDHGDYVNGSDKDLVLYPDMGVVNHVNNTRIRLSFYRKAYLTYRL